MNQTEAGEVPVVEVIGEVDIRSVDALRSAIVASLDQGERCVVDLTKVTFFDSSGLHALNDCRRAADERGMLLALACSPGRVLRLFELMSLDKHFSIYPSIEAAVSEPRIN